MNYQLVVTPPAKRALQTQLPEAVAFAVAEFICGPLLENPHRVGKPLRGELSGIYSARKGTYRVLYRMAESRREVIVLHIAGRADAYRPR